MADASKKRRYRDPVLGVRVLAAGGQQAEGRGRRAGHDPEPVGRILARMRACKVLAHDSGKLMSAKLRWPSSKFVVSNAGSEIGVAAFKIKDLPKAAGKMAGAYSGTTATGGNVEGLGAEPSPWTTASFVAVGIKRLKRSQAGSQRADKAFASTLRGFIYNLKV